MLGAVTLVKHVVPGLIVTPPAPPTLARSKVIPVPLTDALLVKPVMLGPLQQGNISLR